MSRRVLPRLAAALAVLTLAATTACAGGTSSGAEPSTGAGAFPVTVKNKFGSTTIEHRPERVVTVGFNGQDFVLALGVVPVGVRTFLGYDAANRPWAQDRLKGRDLPTVGGQELDLEKVAALKPDLILAVNAYIDQETYDLLSKIAPTVAQSGEYAQGATPWDQQTLLTGKVLGLSRKAEQVVADTQATFDAVVEKHPEFKDKTASFALGGAYSLGPDDYRTGWLAELGFKVPAKTGKVSDERLDVFDTDVLIVEGPTAALEKNPVFDQLDVVREHRVVRLGGFDDDFAGALGFNSPLSLPYVLEVAVPRLAAALDGDPSTRPKPYPTS